MKLEQDALSALEHMPSERRARCVLARTVNDFVRWRPENVIATL